MEFPHTVEVIITYKVSTPDGKYSVTMATEEEAVESLKKLIKEIDGNNPSKEGI